MRIATLITSSTLIDRQAEVVRDVADRVARQEPVDELLDARATLGEEGKAECDVRVDDHVRAAVDRQLDLRSPAVVAVGGPLQVVADELGELLLPGADVHQLEQVCVAALVREVVKHFDAVRVQVLGRERMVDADLSRQDLDGGVDPLQRNSSSPERGEHEGLSEPHEWDRRLAPRTWTTVISGERPSAGLAHSWIVDSGTPK